MTAAPPCPDVEAIAARLAPRPAEEVVAWAVGTFGDRFAIVTAFQAEGMVILDLARRVDPAVRVVTIDTGRLPQATHDFVDAVRARYGLDVEVVAPDAAAIAALVGRHGQNLFRRDVALRQLCCHVRKVEPLARALRDVDAWASGLRRDMSPARAGTAKVELDAAHGAVKVHPLADWTKEAGLGLHPRPPPAGSPAVRGGLREHRLRAVHPAGPSRRGRAGRALVVGDGW